MSELPPQKPAPRRGKRHPLLFQQRLSEQYFWPAVLIVATSSALLIWGPAKVEPYRPALTITATCTGLALILAFIYRLRAYVVCTSHSLRVRLPFRQFEIAYSEIKTVRPTELFRIFPPRQEKWPQRRFLMPILGATVLLIELEQLPKRNAWLRLWMPKYMISPEKVGIIVAVRDWMSFRAELDEFRARQRQIR